MRPHHPNCAPEEDCASYDCPCHCHEQPEDDDEGLDEYDPDEWELVDLAEHVAGTFQRPQPTFLRRRT